MEDQYSRGTGKRPLHYSSSQVPESAVVRCGDPLVELRVQNYAGKRIKVAAAESHP